MAANSHVVHRPFCPKPVRRAAERNRGRPAIGPDRLPTGARDHRHHNASRCASRSAAILYGKEPHFRLISARTGNSLRHCRFYGALSWRAMWNARHVSDQSFTARHKQGLYPGGRHCVQYDQFAAGLPLPVGLKSAREGTWRAIRYRIKSRHCGMHTIEGRKPRRMRRRPHAPGPSRGSASPRHHESLAWSIQGRVRYADIYPQPGRSEAQLTPRPPPSSGDVGTA